MTLVNPKLLASLKRHNPTKVRAFAGDDDPRDISVPTRRKKWAQVIEAIEARSWSRVELLDKAGAVLGYVENTDAARELEDVGPSVVAGSGGQVALAERIVGLVLRGQRETMQFRDAEVTALLKAQGDVVREMTAGMRALTSMYQEQVDAAAQLGDMRATAAAGNNSELHQLLEAAPTLLQMLPLLKGMLGSGDAVPAPRATKTTNGTNH